MRFLALLLLGALLPCSLAAQETKPKKTQPKSVEKLAEEAKESIAVIVFTGRDGKQQGLGTGFVISSDGLIATNYHVIGEARPIRVQFANGKKFEVAEIHASDRSLDLAILRIGAKDLKPLTLGNSDQTRQGQPIVVVGHPRALEFSVVSGVLSGQRDVEGRTMLQIAVPIEQGNSGGPVLDSAGKVLGIVTMKSLVTNNLGFAVPANALKPLLQKPNPIPMERWLTIGQLDKNEWKSVYGGRWRQRAGRIIGDGTGTGFGGRSLCFYQRDVPQLPFEITTTVKLDDEAGAAGLIFGGQGDDRHYGFYPTNGKLRLTRFQGPDVFTWKILEETPSPFYRPGDWNTLKVRLEKDRFLCYLNDHLVMTQTKPDYFGQEVGLAKFRQTAAEFKRFQVAPQVEGSRVDEKTAAQIDKAIARLSLEKSDSGKDLEPLVKLGPASVAALRERARYLEKQAEQLRKIAQGVHQERTLRELKQLVSRPEAELDLLRGALLIAQLDNEELEVENYHRELDRMARDVREAAGKKADPEGIFKALNKYFFEERGFHGSRVEYYSRANSYLNEVIDDREGLPITLSVLYMELARRLDLKVVGLGLPGHFMVRYEPARGDAKVVDVYERGKILTLQEARDQVEKLTGEEPEAKVFEAMPKKNILVRMLHNLMNGAQKEEDTEGVLRYLDGILTLSPDAHEERWVRAVFRFQAGNREGSLEDVELLLEKSPAGINLNRVRELHRLLNR